MPTNNIKDSPRSRSSGAAGVQRTLAPEKSASFHGRLPTSEHRTLRRPKTQPDLLAADSGRIRTPALGKETPAVPWATSAASSGGAPAPQIRVPSKVLVNVTVQRSLGAVQVVASTDWTVGELVAAVLQQYVKEGRRPPLPSSDPSAFALHYSQFSLQCLEAEERLIGLGSRNFFLCPKPAAAAAAAAASSASPAREKTCSKEAAASEMKASSKGGGSGSGSGVTLPWLRFMDFLL